MTEPTIARPGVDPHLGEADVPAAAEATDRGPAALKKALH